jgi:hypothetical protein
VAAEAPLAPRRDRAERPKRKGASALILFVAFGAAPVGVLVWWLFQPEERRQEILARIPEGAGRRAVEALVCLGVLVALARIALPAFHGAAAALRQARERGRTRRPLLRVLLFPYDLLVWILWFLAQILFAVDAVLILVAGAALLLLVASIFKPEIMPDFLRQFLG